MNYLNIENVIVGYDDNRTVHLVREGNNCLVFSDAGKLETVGQGLALTETRFIRCVLFEVDGVLAGIEIHYPGCLIERIPFVIKQNVLELMIKIAKAPFQTFHTQYLSMTEPGRTNLRQYIANFATNDYRNYKPVDANTILNALRLFTIIGDHKGLVEQIEDEAAPAFYKLLDPAVYADLVKRTIRVMYGLFEAPFNVDWSTFPVEVAQPYPTVQIEKWMQDNQIDLKAGIWSDSTQLS
jgi:hypothetical protein